MNGYTFVSLVFDIFTILISAINVTIFLFQYSHLFFKLLLQKEDFTW